MPNQRDTAPSSESTDATICAVTSIDATTACSRVAVNKFSAPLDAVSHLKRSVLLSQIERATQARLILLCAPAGYGKTTLLLQYREHCLAAGRQVLWCNLDVADNDLQRFVQLIASAMETLLPTVQDEPPSQGPDSQPISRLLERLARHDRPLTLLLDEFEEIDNPAVTDFVQQLLKVLPATVTLAITTRRLPKLDLGRLRARGHLLEISLDSLRFTLDETSHYIRDKCSLALPDTDIAALYTKTEGWITAIYLATLSMHWRKDYSAFISNLSGSNLEMAELLAEDILSRQSPQCRQFLLQTSLLDQFSAPLCDALTGKNNSEEMILQLEQNNLFIAPVDDERQWFRYHSIFASFLRHMLDREYPGMSRELHLDAARWYFAEHRAADAIEHLLSAKDYVEAATQLVNLFTELVETDLSRLMLRWVEQIPEAVLDRFPTLRLAYAWALIHARRHQDAMKVIEQAAPSQEAESLRCMLLTLTDHLEQGYQAGRAQLARLSADEDYQYRMVAFALAVSMIGTGRYDEARRLLVAIPQRPRQHPSTYLLTVVDCLSAVLDLIQGQLDTAFTRLQAAAARPPETLKGVTPVGYPSLEVTLGQALYEKNRLDEAAYRLNKVFAYTKDNSSRDTLILNRVLLARIAYLQGDNESWKRNLADLEQLGQLADCPRIICSAWLERARIATLEGRLDTAEHALRTIEQLSDWFDPALMMHGNDVDTPFVARHRLYIAQRDDRGLSALPPAITEAQHRHHHRRALKLRVLYALALNEQGQRDAALAELTVALRVASHPGFLRLFFDEGPKMSALLERWSVTFHGQGAALGIEPEFLNELLAEITNPRVMTESDVEDVSSALSVRELQVLRLLALGYRNREIAERIFISELTVKSHLRKINTKLGARSRTEAVSIARSSGLLD
ncbi:helix-turn-helix transcriptional regulator [Pseudomonas sp. GW456-E7]|nr:helix-turn-helix transcriptional regulator [Pseudomonas sp. GW456-E7]